MAMLKMNKEKPRDFLIPGLWIPGVRCRSSLLVAADY
jgi:hypothetical protein